MRSCCIESCRSRCTDAGISLFEIHDGRKEWIALIQKYQPLVHNHRLYICDLHFEPQFIRKTDKKSSLKKGAVPSFQIQSRNQNQCISDISSETIEETNGTCIDLAAQNYDEFQPLVADSDFFNEPTSSIAVIIDAETQIKSISFEEYNGLLQLIPKVAKLEMANESLKNEIKRRDEIIKEMRGLHKREMAIRNNFSSLTMEQVEVVECLINGNKHKQYTEHVRSFCLKQHFHSNAAYESLRLFFNKHLPSTRTLRFWYTSIDGSPGINISSLEVLHEKAASYQEKKNHPMHVALISDEMSIRKDISWCRETHSFMGFSTISSSQSIQENQSEQNIKQPEIAKNALVLLVVGSDFKIPVAYHLVAGLESFDRAEFTRQVIKCVEDTGVKVMCLTSDGLYANLTVAELLGAKFNEEKPYFQSLTYPEQKIYIIFDPPHMLKLVRKHFSIAKLYSHDKLLDWNLLRILVEKQRVENFNLCNNLTQHHIDWKYKPQNVKLAAQTISRSAANTLEQLRLDGYEEFKDAEQTVEFLRNFNDMFDVLNCAEKDKKNAPLRQPLCEKTAETILAFAKRMKEYIQQLKIDVQTKNATERRSVFKSRAHMGFIGFYNNFVSLEGIYNDFVRNGPLDVFHTKIFSQDHLETFFSLVRNRQGRNDNPNAVEFASAFKKLLICHPLTTSTCQDVISNATGLLTVSSRVKKQLPPTNSVESECVDVNNEELENDLNNNLTDPYGEHLNAHLALCVEEKCVQAAKLSTKSSCLECANILLDNIEKINDGLLAMKNKEHPQPCRSTLEIVTFSEAIMKKISSNERGIPFDVVNETIYKSLKMDELYAGSDFEHNQQNHKEEFVRRIIKTYLTMKSQQIGKRIADEERGAFIRGRLKNQVHFAGQ